jgi:hypothetical protein
MRAAASNFTRRVPEGSGRQPASGILARRILLAMVLLPILYVPEVRAQEYAASIASRHVLTNEGVIALAKAGFDELFIVERIRTSRVKFDVSIEGLVALKQAGLSEEVIRLIAQRDNQEYRTTARLSFYGPPAGMTLPALPPPPDQPTAPAASRTPTITEKHWWVFRWIRVSQ